VSRRLYTAKPCAIQNGKGITPAIVVAGPSSFCYQRLAAIHQLPIEIALQPHQRDDRLLVWRLVLIHQYSDHRPHYRDGFRCSVSGA
jgi:hypothetical protein